MLFDIGLHNIFFGYVSSGKKNKIKKQKQKQMGLHQTKKLLHSKGNYHQNEMAVYRMGGDFANNINDKGLISKRCK